MRVLLPFLILISIAATAAATGPPPSEVWFGWNCPVAYNPAAYANVCIGNPPMRRTCAVGDEGCVDAPTATGPNGAPFVWFMAGYVDVACNQPGGCGCFGDYNPSFGLGIFGGVRICAPILG